MIDILLDSLLDTLKLLPYLFLTFIILEFIEHKLSKKNQKILVKDKKYGPILGGVLGAFPQCGFSSMGANLYSNKIITMGTLIAIFLSTSDEMLPIMLSEKANLGTILKIVGFKVIIGIIVGILVDLIYFKKSKNINKSIEHLCEEEHCHCDDKGIFISSLIHTLKICIFIFLANLIIGLIIFKFGEENLSNLLLNKSIITCFIASLIGLIPNCASSVIMTELYLSGLLKLGSLLSGLLTGSGLGILLLFKTNKNMKENITILSIIYFVGVLVGIIVDLIV